MKFLVVIDALTVGGIGMSFRNYVNYISKKVNCDILVFNDIDMSAENLPENVNIINSNYALRMLGMSQTRIRSYSLWLSLLRIILVGIAKLSNGMLARKILFKFAPKLEHYDVVISYPHDPKWNSLARGCNQFVLENVEASIKATFIHCDYKNFGGFNPKQVKVYQKFDRIICVSNSCRESFVSCFPTLKSNVISCENFTDTDRIEKSINKENNQKSDIIRIVTVCRISKEKGIERAIYAFSKLSDKENKFKWTIVGGGYDLERLKKLVVELGLESNIIFVGEQENPYPFIYKSDVFLLPSFHEAAPMVFGECIALGVPVITTKTCSAIELVEARKIGIVCENTDEGIYQVLRSLMNGKLDLIHIKKQINPKEVNKYAQKQFDDFLQYCIGEI